jgi:non-ribosomal peptide synthetase component F
MTALFLEQIRVAARRTPERTALACGEQQLSYRAVIEQASALARYFAPIDVREHARLGSRKRHEA